MKAFVFPGQGAQFVGMGKDLYEASQEARSLFAQANDILGFDITELMFSGTPEDLRQTKVTQPAVFIHSVVKAKTLGEEFAPDMVAGHSLGEFSALTAAGALSFEDGLRLVTKRAMAMQKACELQESGMSAVLGLPDSVVEDVCRSVLEEVIVPANYNCPGQIVISGSKEGLTVAAERLKAAGAKRVLPLAVGGAFHSPLMEPARVELAEAIANTRFSSPLCPVYQNVTAEAYTDASLIKENLIAQLTSPVKWTQIVLNMISAGADEFIELGPGTVLQGLISKIQKSLATE